MLVFTCFTLKIEGQQYFEISRDSHIENEIDKLVEMVSAFKIYEFSFRDRNQLDDRIFQESYFNTCKAKILQLSNLIQPTETDISRCRLSRWNKIIPNLERLSGKLSEPEGIITKNISEKRNNKYALLITEINRFIRKVDLIKDNNFHNKISAILIDKVDFIKKSTLRMDFSLRLVNANLLQNLNYIKNIEVLTQQVHTSTTNITEKVNSIQDYLESNHTTFFGLGFTGAQELQSVDFFQFKTMPSSLVIGKSRSKELLRPSFTFATTYFYNFTEELGVSATAGGYIAEIVGVEFGAIRPNQTSLSFLSRVYFIYNKHILFSANYDPLRKFGVSVMYSFKR
ncbi:hypothetical protein ADIS_1717 [Lunatimonas lonarensis]|uniref:Uncharacterized protein n=2 Tax=Lunatimonas lonarensis TaxID=1232681 RepID=R7ZUU2_9BACT|nr:hypothetical protein ADIS_1717 [Lunatimonas lonarensis]